MKMQYNPGTTGLAIYAVVFNSAGQAWKPASSAFTTYTTSRSDFTVSLPEIGVTGFYGPTTIPGTGPNRVWYIYQQTGGSPSHTDTLIKEVYETYDVNTVQIAGSTAAASGLYALIGDTNTTVSETLETLNSVQTDIGGVLSRIGLFTGTGVNNILGFLRSLMRKDLAAPSDVGGAFDPAHDSLEAHTDGEATIKEISTAGMAKLINTNTGETSAVSGSVAKIAQGAADANTLLNEVLGTYAAGSWGERLKRIPNAAAGGAGGLPTVDASNRVAGVQSAANITSTGNTILISASGKVTAGTVNDKVGYELTATEEGLIADAVAAQTNVAAGLTNIVTALGVLQTDLYTASISMIKDSTTDEYTIQWFKNGIPITSGITSPTIQVIKRSDGTNLIASTALTQIGSTGAYKYDATTTARLASGDSAVVVVTATIDASSRVWRKPIGKDV